MEPAYQRGYKVFKFKLFFRDGTFKITDNMTLRRYCPGVLIDFYESNIHVNYK
jgi:hypothetical protein